MPRVWGYERSNNIHDHLRFISDLNGAWSKLQDAQNLEVCDQSYPEAIKVQSQGLSPKSFLSAFFGWSNPVRLYSLYKILYPKRRI